MVIGIDARFYGPLGGGGLGRYTKELVDNLEQIDRKNQYVIFLRRENWDDYNPEHANFRKVLAPYKWYSWREQIFMPFKIWREKVDLMHFPHFNIPILYACGVNSFGRLSKLKWINKIFTRKHTKRNTKAHENWCNAGFILTIHDLILLKYPSKKATTLAPIYFKFKFFAYKIIISAALRRAGKIIVPSNFVKNDIIKYFNVHPEKIEVIYEGVAAVDKENGFGENRFVEGGEEVKKDEEGEEGKTRIMNHELGIMNGKEEEDNNFKIWYNKCGYILYVGNAYPHKNLEKLVEAFAIVLKNPVATLPVQAGLCRPKKERELKLALVGVKNYFYERLEEYVKNNFPDIKNRIIFLGYATDKELVNLYKNAALYVFPSLEEGFGLPPLEAMSYGIPVISSHRSCLPEILKDAVLYFDAEAVKDMAEKISRGLDDKNLRDGLVKQGYELVKNYDWKKNAKRTLEVYGEVGSL